MRSITSLLIVLCLALAACSGADDTATDTTAADGTATDAAADDAAEEPAAADASTTIDAGQCEELATAFGELGTAIQGATTGTADAAAIEAQLEEFRTATESLPAEVATDAQLVADAYGEIATTLAEAGIEPGAVPDAEAQAALQELGTSLSAPELTTASTNVATYFSGGCQ